MTSRPVVKTGCLSCHARGTRCNGRTSRCSQHTSSAWITNHSLGDRSAARPPISSDATCGISYAVPGTHRERRSLDFYLHVSASSLSGYLDSAFWLIRLPQSTLLNSAIRHAVVALGASHEHRLRKQAARYSAHTEELNLFAIRQCNKAIQELMRPSKTEYGALMRAMVAAVVFACLEGMQGEARSAAVHVRHLCRMREQLWRSLMRRSEAGAGEDTLPIDLATLEPLVTHYECQQDDENDSHVSDARAEDESLDFDCIFTGDAGQPTFRTISDARSSLEAAIAKLGVILVKLEDPASRTPSNVAAVQATKTEFSAFFRRWDSAFTILLQQSSISEDATTLHGYRLLQSHRMAGSILADVEFETGEAAWEPFTESFATIVELLGQVSQDNIVTRAGSLNVPQEAYYSVSMGLTEPLYCAATRCRDPLIAQRARMLLSKLPVNEGAHSRWRVDFIERILCACTGKPYGVDKGS